MDGSLPSITDDGAWTYYGGTDGEIYVVATFGGTPVLLTRPSDSIVNQRPSVSGDNTRVAFSSFGGELVAGANPDGGSELVVMDVGAKFHGYCADVTRTIPVNGRFTKRQREIYTYVYDASRKAAAVLRPGATIRDAHKAAADHLEQVGYRKYFLHSVGHGLGLEVHDWPVGGQKLKPGMVVTIEPGIYIADEELGVRIEDDYLITEDGAELLSDQLPSHPDELEAFLAELRGR